MYLIRLSASVAFDALRVLAAVVLGVFIALVIAHLRDVAREASSPTSIQASLQEAVQAPPVRAVPMLWFRDASRIPDSCTSGLYADMGEQEDGSPRYLCLDLSSTPEGL
jgi:hypothetical protein